MKILHALETSVPELVGYTVRGRYIVTHQRRQGLDPLVVTSPFFKGAVGPQPEVIDGIRYFRSNHIPRPDRSKGRLSAYWTRLLMLRRYRRFLAELVRRERPDVIHAHSSYTNGLAAAYASRVTGVPFIYELRTLWGEAAVVEEGLRPESFTYRIIGRMEHRVMTLAQRLVVISEGIRRAITAAGIDPAKIDVVPNGVDTEQFNPCPRDTALEAELGLAGCFVVGFIGSLRKLEGLELLVDAFASIRRGEPRARLLIVGDGPERVRLESRARELGLQGVVRCTGLVPHIDVIRYYSIMDVMVYPRIDARINQTVTPLKPLEAMALGKVCVASDVGGLRELVTDGSTGLLFAAGDGSALAERIVTLAGNSELRQRLETEALSTVRRERDWRVIAARYKGIYGRVLPGRGV